MIQLYREGGGLSTGNSGNSPGNSGNGGAGGRRGFSRGFLGGIGSGKGPGSQGEGGAGKAPRPRPEPGIWEQFSHFSFRKRVLAGIWDPFPILGFSGSLFLCQRKKKKSPLFFLFSPFSGFFPPPAPLGMSRHVRVSFLGPLEFQDSGIASFPTKHTRNVPRGEKKSRKNKKTPKIITKKVDFAGKASPAPSGSGNSWEEPGGVPETPNPPKIQHSRGIPGRIWDHPNPNFPWDTGKGPGGVLCTRRRFPALEPIPEFREF